MKSPEPLPKAESDTDAPQHNGRKMLFDFGPLLVFFGTNYLYNDLMLSVKVLVAATLVSLALSWHIERRVSLMAAIGCAALVFFAGLTLYFDNELFIKIKPTVVTSLFAALIAGGRLLGRNPLAAIIGKQIDLTPQGWRAISWLWVAMFATSAVANELAWRTLSTDDWITFKVFGLTGISLLFFVLSVPILQKHQRQN
jgi:intracellular septation protein